MRILHILAIALVFVSCKESKQEEVPSSVTVVTVEEMQTLLANGELQLVDVRTPEEFEEGHVMNAINIDYKGAAFEKEIEALDKTKPVMVYCRSGRRSAKGCEVLKSQGFTEIYDLNGGILQWQKEGKLIYTPDDIMLE